MASEKTVGVLGGGQLGRMLVEAANLLEVRVNFLDAPASSAKQVSAHDGHVDGSFKSKDAIQELANRSDVVTGEFLPFLRSGNVGREAAGEDAHYELSPKLPYRQCGGTGPRARKAVVSKGPQICNE